MNSSVNMDICVCCFYKAVHYAFTYTMRDNNESTVERLCTLCQDQITAQHYYDMSFDAECLLAEVVEKPDYWNERLESDGGTELLSEFTNRAFGTTIAKLSP